MIWRLIECPIKWLIDGLIYWLINNRVITQSWSYHSFFIPQVCKAVESLRQYHYINLLTHWAYYPKISCPHLQENKSSIINFISIFSLFLIIKNGYYILNGFLATQQPEQFYICCFLLPVTFLLAFAPR